MSTSPVDAAAMATVSTSDNAAGDPAVNASDDPSQRPDGTRSKRSSKLPLNQLQDQQESLENDLQILLSENLNEFEMITMH